MYTKALKVMQNQTISPWKKLMVWNGVQNFYFGIRWHLLRQKILAKRVPAARVIAMHVYTAEVGRGESVCISIDTAGAPCFPSTMLHTSEMQKYFCIF